jgi:hypothetical protein
MSMSSLIAPSSFSLRGSKEGVKREILGTRRRRGEVDPKGKAENVDQTVDLMVCNDVYFFCFFRDPRWTYGGEV